MSKFYYKHTKSTRKNRVRSMYKEREKNKNENIICKRGAKVIVAQTPYNFISIFI